jgi:hypothetical protein
MARTFTYTTEVFDEYTYFPATGDVDVIYIDASKNIAYRYDDSYYTISSAEVDIWGAMGSLSKGGGGGGGASWGSINGTLSNQTDLNTALSEKQNTLVSGASIKTINSTSLLGSGDVAVQPTLVSGTNIKTIEGQSLLGSGNINLTASDVGLGNVDNTSDLNKPISTATQTALNAKQNALTLTTTGTSGAATLVGATLNIPQYSGGGGGLQGVHALIPLASGQSTFAGTASQGLTGSLTTTNRLAAIPFIPNQNITASAFYINVVSTGGGNVRVLIYSNLNGLPNQKLYESATLDCSTTGVKTATTTFNFVAGTTYWMTLHSSTGIQLSFIQTSALFPLSITGFANPNTFVFTTATFGSAPTTFGTPNFSNGNAPFIGITKA